MGFARPGCPVPLRFRELFLLEGPVAGCALLAVGQSGAFRTQPRVWSHGAVVGEATLALNARLAGFAANVESFFQDSPAMLEFRGWFVSCAGGASVRPRFRRAVVAHLAALRFFSEMADLERFVTHAASAKEILLL